MKKNIVLMIYFMLLSFHAFAFEQPSIYPFSNIEEAKRFTSLTNEIRCVVCQNQSLADSNAILAGDLREKIYKMVLDKKTNHEIKTYLVQRYGEFILFQPRVNKTNIILWSFPFLGLSFIFIILFNFVKKGSS